MFSNSSPVKSFAVFPLLVCAACAGSQPRGQTQAPQVFYTVTGEIALARQEMRIAALQYLAAAETERDTALLRRATEVSVESLQPSLTLAASGLWLEVDGAALDAHRAAARAALDLHDIPQAVRHFAALLRAGPPGEDTEFAWVDGELAAAANVYGARQVADVLAKQFPHSAAVLRMQAFAALRADDPAAAVTNFAAALAAAPATAEVTRGWWRARILAGDRSALAEARAQLAAENTAENQLEYAMLLLAAQDAAQARAELEALRAVPAAHAVASRLLGLLDFQDGRLDAAALRFAELLTSERFADDARYYLGLIAERHKDWDRALHLYSDVQTGDNAVPAMLRAAALLRAHGAEEASGDLLDALLVEAPQHAPDILAERARIEADAGNQAQATAVLEHAVLEYPDSVELRYARATLAEQQGRLGDALSELKAVAALRPSDPAALNAYGYTLADHERRLGEARRLIERAHAAAPKNVAILDSLGWVLFRQGHGAAALPYLEAAYADERDGDVAAHLGEVLWQLGRRADAERIWREADAGGDNRLLNATRLRLHAANQP